MIFENMNELNCSQPQINYAKKELTYDHGWKLKVTDGTIIISCNIVYQFKEELVDKLNAIEGYIHDGWLYIGNKKYQVQLLQGITLYTDFSSFNLIFKFDQYEYTVYKYVKSEPIVNNAPNPLQTYNFTGASPLSIPIVLNFDMDNDIIITPDFSIVNGTIYGAYIPQGYVESGSEILLVTDKSE